MFCSVSCGEDVHSASGYLAPFLIFYHYSIVQYRYIISMFYLYIYIHICSICIYVCVGISIHMYRYILCIVAFVNRKSCNNS